MLSALKAISSHCNVQLFFSICSSLTGKKINKINNKNNTPGKRNSSDSKTKAIKENI
jgi:hypothetical protein